MRLRLASTAAFALCLCLAACGKDDSSTPPVEMQFRANLERTVLPPEGMDACAAIPSATPGLRRTARLAESFDPDRLIVAGVGEDEGSTTEPDAGGGAAVVLPPRPISMQAEVEEAVLEGYYVSEGVAAAGSGLGGPLLECCVFPQPESIFTPADVEDRNLMLLLAGRFRASGPVYCAVPPEGTTDCAAYLCARFKSERASLPTHFCDGQDPAAPDPGAPLCQSAGRLIMEFTRRF